MRPSRSSRFAASAARRAFAATSSTWVPARSNRSSTFDATLLTFWPPGPDARTALHTRSAAGMTTPGRTTSGSFMTTARSVSTRAVLGNALGFADALHVGPGAPRRAPAASDRGHRAPHHGRDPAHGADPGGVDADPRAHDHPPHRRHGLPAGVRAAPRSIARRVRGPR